jgi:hypothetical protein
MQGWRQMEYKGSRIYSACLSPESVAILNATGRSSGLFPVYRLPISFKMRQWLKCKRIRLLLETCETHSYGDSAGIAPASLLTPYVPAKPIRCGDQTLQM